MLIFITFFISIIFIIGLGVLIYVVTDNEMIVGLYIVTVFLICLAGISSCLTSIVEQNYSEPCKKVCEICDCEVKTSSDISICEECEKKILKKAIQKEIHKKGEDDE